MGWYGRVFRDEDYMGRETMKLVIGKSETKIQIGQLQRRSRSGIDQEERKEQKDFERRELVPRTATPCYTEKALKKSVENGKFLQITYNYFYTT